MTSLVRRTVDTILVVLAVACLGIGIVLQAIPVTGRQLVLIAGASMEPALPIGSLAVVTAVPEADLVPGDIVTVRSDAGRAVVTHRIVRIVERERGIWLELRGDANEEPDPVLVPATTLLGRVESVHPNLGRLVRSIGTPSGVLVACGLGGLLLAASMALRLREPANRAGGVGPGTSAGLAPGASA